MHKPAAGLILLLAVSSLVLAGAGAMALFGQQVFSADNNGQTVDVNSGDSFWVRLPENPTTGYAWNLTLSDGLTLLQDKYEPADTSTMKIGVGGFHSWEVRAAKNGAQSIAGAYRRPWEPDSPGASNYSLIVNVVNGGLLSNLFHLPAMLTGGTSVPSLPATDSQKASQDIIVSHMDVPPEETIAASVGDTIRLTLAENPSTGYSWQITSSDGLEPAGDSYTPGRPGMAGAPGTHEWAFKVIKPGPQQVSGVYRRPWEGTRSDDKRYTLNVNVG